MRAQQRTSHRVEMFDAEMALRWRVAGDGAALSLLLFVPALLVRVPRARTIYGRSLLLSMVSAILTLQLHTAPALMLALGLSPFFDALSLVAPAFSLGIAATVGLVIHALTRARPVWAGVAGASIVGIISMISAWLVE